MPAIADTPRFTLARTSANAWYIRDGRDEKNPVVAMIHQGRRDPVKTEAMIRVMVDALNTEAARRSARAQAAPTATF